MKRKYTEMLSGHSDNQTDEMSLFLEQTHRITVEGQSKEELQRSIDGLQQIQRGHLAAFQGLSHTKQQSQAEVAKLKAENALLQMQIEQHEILRQEHLQTLHKLDTAKTQIKNLKAERNALKEALQHHNTSNLQKDLNCVKTLYAQALLDNKQLQQRSKKLELIEGITNSNLQDKSPTLVAINKILSQQASLVVEEQRVPNSLGDGNDALQYLEHKCITLKKQIKDIQDHVIKLHFNEAAQELFAAQQQDQTINGVEPEMKKVIKRYFYADKVEKLSVCCELERSDDIGDLKDFDDLETNDDHNTWTKMLSNPNQNQEQNQKEQLQK